MRLNHKGVVGTGLIAVVAVGMVIAAIGLTPKHRVRKAIEKCELTEPTGTDCIAFVKKVKADGGLSGRRPEYIRDK